MRKKEKVNTTEDLQQFISDEMKMQLDRFSASIKNQKEPEELLTRKEASKLLKVSLVTLNAWTMEGLIKAYRINTRVRYKYSELVRSLKQIETSNK